MKKCSQTDQVQDTSTIAIKIQSDNKNAFKKTFNVDQVSSVLVITLDLHRLVSLLCSYQQH